MNTIRMPRLIGSQWYNSSPLAPIDLIKKVVEVVAAFTELVKTIEEAIPRLEASLLLLKR